MRWCSSRRSPPLPPPPSPRASAADEAPAHPGADAALPRARVGGGEVLGTQRGPHRCHGGHRRLPLAARRAARGRRRFLRRGLPPGPHDRAPHRPVHAAGGGHLPPRPDRGVGGGCALREVVRALRHGRGHDPRPARLGHRLGEQQAGLHVRAVGAPAGGPPHRPGRASPLPAVEALRPRRREARSGAARVMTLGQTSAGKDLKARYLWLGLVMVGGLLLLAGRLYRLQIARGDEYAAKSVANFVKEIRVKADRGIIKDRRAEILVDSRPSFDVFITPAFCERCSDEVLPRLGGWLGWDGDQHAHVEQLLRAAKRSAPFQPVPVQLDLNRDELDTLNAHKLELPGVDWPAVPHRNYRTGIVLPHVVGYMNEITQDELERLNAQGEGYALGDFIGRRGVERFFERRLRGKDGSRKEVVNARGETIQELSDLITGEATVASTPGDNVVLSIDMRLQAAAE